MARAAACGWATRRSSRCSSPPAPGLQRSPSSASRARSTRCARSRTGTRPRALYVDRHALLGQHHDRASTTFLALLAPSPRPSPISSSAPTIMSSCASTTAAAGDPVPEAADRKLPPDFFPMTCRTCVDYTNALADITVGYMGGEGEQWLMVRNERGEALLDLLGGEVRTAAPGSSGKRARGGRRASRRMSSAPPAACRCAPCRTGCAR
jgi:hypothetical protein